MTWKKIGKVGVDSGTLMVVDPAYKDDLPNYHKLTGFTGKGKNKKHDKKITRQIGKGQAVVFDSGLGDGEYNVYADIGKVDKWGKRVKQVLIKLI